MATLVITDSGENAIINRAMGKTVNGDLTVRLFQNDVTPVEATVAGDLTECTATGYSAVTITADDITVTDGTASFSVSFTGLTATPDQTVYGVAVEDALGNLIGAAALDAAEVISTSSKDLTGTITITGA